VTLMNDDDRVITGSSSSSSRTAGRHNVALPYIDILITSWTVRQTDCLRQQASDALQSSVVVVSTPQAGAVLELHACRLPVRLAPTTAYFLGFYDFRKVIYM